MAELTPRMKELVQPYLAGIEPYCAVGVDPAALTQLGQHFQHTGHPIQAQVF